MGTTKTNTGRTIGIRCAQDKYGKLWVGRVKDDCPFIDVFTVNTNKKIISALSKVRTTGGAFWFNPLRKLLSVVTEETKENKEYPWVFLK